jgi:hypothetical protein
MNLCDNCLLISATKSLCESRFLAFITRTIDASTRCLLSSSTVEGTPLERSPPSSSPCKTDKRIRVRAIF